jgi:hypothetical protein
MTKVRILIKEDKELEDEINKWLRYKQDDSTINFQLIDIKLSVTDTYSGNRHDRAYIAATIIYSEDRNIATSPVEPPPLPPPFAGVGSW